MNSKHEASVKTELEIETFKPNLKEASDLLEADQIEKVRKPELVNYKDCLCDLRVYL